MRKYHRPLVFLTFALYLLVAFWIYFFKASLGKDLVFLHWKSSMNWIPFQEVFTKEGIDISEMILQILNFIGFIPLGMLSAGLFKKHQFIFGSFICLCYTVFIEMMQMAFSFGSPQIGDIIMNGLGGILGSFLYIIIAPKVNIKTQSYIYFTSSIICVTLIVLGIVTTCIRWEEYITNPYL